MSYVLYFILSAVLIMLSQAVASRGGDVCCEWTDAVIKEPKKKSPKKKEPKHKARIIRFEPGRSVKARKASGTVMASCYETKAI